MYEDLNTIAQLKFDKQIESISAQTREKVKETQNEYAALTGSTGVRGGPHEASIARIQIAGAEKMVHTLSDIWIDLIKQRKGYISRQDVAFIVEKAEGYARTKKGHLHTAFAHQRMGAVVDLLTQEAERQMHAVAASIRRDLEIMAREHEAFPSGAAQQKGHSMTQSPNIHLHIENSSVANLNLGSQVGTINAALESISAQQGASPHDLALALKQLTEATVAHAALPPGEKHEIVQALSTLAEQATKKPEERSQGTLRAIISRIPTSIAAAGDLMTLWGKYGPAIRAYFGF